MKAFFETLWYFMLKYWIPLVIVAIAIVQMFVGKWWILLIMLVVATVGFIVTAVKK